MDIMKYKCEFHGLYSCYHYYVRKSYHTDRKCVKVQRPIFWICCYKPNIFVSLQQNLHLDCTS